MKNIHALGLLIVLAAALAWLNVVGQAVGQTRSVNVACCEQANADCLKFCGENPSRSGCKDACKRMFGGCTSRGTYEWRTRAATDCRAPESISARPELRVFCDKQNSVCTGAGCSGNPGPIGVKHCQEVTCGGRLLRCLQSGCYEWRTRPAECFGK